MKCNICIVGHRPQNHDIALLSSGELILVSTNIILALPAATSIEHCETLVCVFMLPLGGGLDNEKHDAPTAADRDSHYGQ